MNRRSRIILACLMAAAPCLGQRIHSFSRTPEDSCFCRKTLETVRHLYAAGPFINWGDLPVLMEEERNRSQLKKYVDSVAGDSYTKRKRYIVALVDSLGRIRCMQFDSPFDSSVNYGIFCRMEKFRFVPGRVKGKPAEQHYIFPLLFGTQKEE